MEVPQVNMLLISKNAMKYRNVCTRFLFNNINLSVFDYKRISEIDTFYNLCQQQRDYYRDPYNKLKKIDYFDKPSKKFELCFDLTKIYLRQPTCYVEQIQPIVYRTNFDLTSALKQTRNYSGIINSRGRYDTKCCSKYKR